MPTIVLIFEKKRKITAAFYAFKNPPPNPCAVAPLQLSQHAFQLLTRLILSKKNKNNCTKINVLPFLLLHSCTYFFYYDYAVFVSFSYSFICQGTSTRRQRRELFGLRVKRPPITISLTTQKEKQSR